jgi:hypothetical protein
MDLDKHAFATVALYPAEEDGRRGSLLPGRWRADIRFGGAGEPQFGFLADIDAELSAGESREMALAFRRPDLVAPFIGAGVRFFICSGHPIGEGTILASYLPKPS